MGEEKQEKKGLSGAFEKVLWCGGLWIYSDVKY